MVSVLVFVLQLFLYLNLYLYLRKGILTRGKDGNKVVDGLSSHQAKAPNGLLVVARRLVTMEKD